MSIYAGGRRGVNGKWTEMTRITAEIGGRRSGDRYLCSKHGCDIEMYDRSSVPIIINK
jgi:hypothetical protein